MDTFTYTDILVMLIKGTQILYRNGNRLCDLELVNCTDIEYTGNYVPCGFGYGKVFNKVYDSRTSVLVVV